MITLLLVAAALAWLFWPRGATAPAIPAASDLFRVPPQVAAAPPRATTPATPGEREAIDSMLVVRNRLAAGGSLNEGSAKAIDQLLLDIVHQGATK